MQKAAVIVALASFAGSLALFAAGTGHYPWYVSRAAGLLSLAMLNVSVALGLLISSKSPPSWFPKPLLFDLHQFLAVLALALVAIHAGALMFDEVVPFSPADVLVPFASGYRPLLTATGILAAWLSVAVAVSFWAKKRIGQKAWRRLHYASFGAYALGVIHGLGIGSDAQVPLVYWLTIAGAAAVAALTVYRIAATRSRPSPRRAPARKAPAAATHGSRAAESS
jgi:sulfoxide reductase heme-binding subunit YedZ